MSARIDFSGDWRYFGGDIAPDAPNDKQTVYMQAKTERRLYGPAAEAFDDGAFAPVTLPHDALIAQTPRPEGNEGLGYFRYHTAWYRKRFRLPDDARGDARAYLRFGGAATDCEVYVNGCLAARHFGGYAPFTADITNFSRFGGDNTVSVRVKSDEIEGWWYQGAGLYRGVELWIAGSAHIAEWGVFARPEKENGSAWRVPVRVEILNRGPENAKLRVKCEIVGEDGRVCARGWARKRVDAWGEGAALLNLRVESPEIWNVWDAHMYEARVSLYSEGARLDEARVSFGFREIHWDAGGVWVNGRRVPIRGVCLHQDFGLTGKEMPPEIAKYRVSLMKEMGANAVRLAHYPHPECEMDALDRAGMLCMAETRAFSAEPSAISDMEALIRRDRNHPCVFLWSMGNEEPLHAEARGAKIAREMIARAKALDPSRAATTVVCHAPENAPVYGECDVICLNYHLESYDALREKYPDKPFLAGEWCAAGTTRGWYAPDDPARGRVWGYDHDPENGFSASREYTHAFASARPWLAGGFQWAGVEHRGECKWPRLCSVSGALDLFLLKKDAFYQNQSHMLTSPMIHLLPHWNAPRAESGEADIWVYTNCEKAELFVNGKSLGIQDTQSGMHARWRAPYAPGSLRAVGYKGGERACEDARETTGAPVALRLTQLAPYAWLFACECVDEAGRAVPDANPVVSFRAEGGMEIVGTGSDNADPTPPRVPERRMYMGQIAVYARPASRPGAPRLIAEAPGLKMATIAPETEEM